MVSVFDVQESIGFSILTIFLPADVWKYYFVQYVSVQIAAFWSTIET